MKSFTLLLSLFVGVLPVHAEIILPDMSMAGLPADSVSLPPTMAGRLALVRETIELVEMLQTVVEEPEMQVSAAASVRLMGEKWLLPRCRVLQQLSSEQLSELLLLADAIDWQGAWLLDMAEADSCVAMPRPAESGSCLERLQIAAASIKKQMLNTRYPELAAELQALVKVVGGAPLLEAPARLLSQRMVRDYKTVYAFLSEFKAALEQGDATAMADLRDYTDYLLRNEVERLRVDALAAVYASVCRAEYKVRPPRFRVDSAMQQALHPFLAQLPSLLGVLP